MTHNIAALLSLMKHMYENIMYSECNTKSDYCAKCGSTHEIQILDKGGKLIWHCPVCGNEDRSQMNITRRVCGYISTNEFNQGRTEEIKERYVHMTDHDDTAM